MSFAAGWRSEKDLRERLAEMEEQQKKDRKLIADLRDQNAKLRKGRKA